MTTKLAVFESMCDLIAEVGQEKAWRTIMFDLWPLVRDFGKGANYYELERQVESTQL